jgi:hypothetical protein
MRLRRHERCPIHKSPFWYVRSPSEQDNQLAIQIEEELAQLSAVGRLGKHNTKAV